MSSALMADEISHGRPAPVLQKPPGFRDPQQAGIPPVAARPPARKASLPQTFRQVGKATSTRHRRRNRSICRGCRCCCLCLFIVCLVFLLALAGAVCYLYLQPHLPSFRLQSVQAPKFNVTTRSDGSGTFVDGTAEIKIFASNQNCKIVFSYGESSAAVYVLDDDGDVSMGLGSMPGFVQGQRNATVMKFSAAVRGELVDDAVGSRIRSRFRSKEIRFRVEVKTSMGFGLGGSGGGMTGRVPIRVDCPPVNLKQVKDVRILPKCNIYLFRW